MAPAGSITQAEHMAAETAERRAAQRERSAERREREEADYEAELVDAIIGYLDFADEHTELPRQIADATYQRIRDEAHAAVNDDYILQHRSS